MIVFTGCRFPLNSFIHTIPFQARFVNRKPTPRKRPEKITYNLFKFPSEFIGSFISDLILYGKVPISEKSFFKILHRLASDGQRSEISGENFQWLEKAFMVSSMSLKGKRALVTGGAVRIGRAITEALQTAGAEVVVHYLGSHAEAKALSPHSVQANLQSPEECARLIEEAGPIDILVNNASLFTKDRLMDSFPERVHREFQVNLFAPMELIRLFAAQAEEGAVINLLDRRIQANDTTALHYSISKKGLEDLTKLTALDLAPNIRVNAVAPGPVLPAPGDSAEIFAEKAGRVPLELFPTPGNVAEAVLFLLNAEYCTGQVIYVDGGQHLLGNGV